MPPPSAPRISTWLRRLCSWRSRSISLSRPTKGIASLTSLVEALACITRYRDTKVFPVGVISRRAVSPEGGKLHCLENNLPCCSKQAKRTVRFLRVAWGYWNRRLSRRPHAAHVQWGLPSGAIKATALLIPTITSNECEIARRRIAPFCLVRARWPAADCIWQCVQNDRASRS